MRAVLRGVVVSLVVAASSFATEARPELMRVWREGNLEQALKVVKTSPWPKLEKPLRDLKSPSLPVREKAMEALVQVLGEPSAEIAAKVNSPG